MAHQAIGDVPAELLDQIRAGKRVGTVGGDGAYDSKSCHAAIAAGRATPSIPRRADAVDWKTSTRCNEAVDTITQVGRRERTKGCGHHCPSLTKNAMYRFKTHTGGCLRACLTDSRATEAAARVVALNSMTELARSHSDRIV